jgi:hypothetical protein
MDAQTLDLVHETLALIALHAATMEGRNRCQLVFLRQKNEQIPIVFLDRRPYPG